ncbi:hypothetical protein BDF19DRAFT_420437 [Syncephalis fuscata]|nr:hypothetical protein BDF19DRAFT_420437 [Syncephalis fuscata]
MALVNHEIAAFGESNERSRYSNMLNGSHITKERSTENSSDASTSTVLPSSIPSTRQSSFSSFMGAASGTATNVPAAIMSPDACRVAAAGYARPSDTISPTLAGLRFLVSLDQHQREHDIRDTARVQSRILHLHLANRLVIQSDDDHDRLHELFRPERLRNFVGHYERRCQGLEQAIADNCMLISIYLLVVILDTLSPSARRTCLRFVAYLRTNPSVIADVFYRASDQELHSLLPNDELNATTNGYGNNGYGNNNGHTNYTAMPSSPLASPSISMNGTNGSSGNNGNYASGNSQSAGTGINAPSNVVDLLISGIYGSYDFASEQRFQLKLWTTVFVRLISERRGERFLLDVLDRFVRRSGWSARGALETQLMKILRRGEEIVLDGNRRSADSNAANLNTPATPSRLRTTTNYNAVNEIDNLATDAFFDHACEEILAVLDLYIPTCLLALSRSVLSELPSDLRQYATILLLVKFFFYRFLGRAITYPEYYGMCDDYFISEEQRQSILFKTNQRLYRYATVVCSAAPGWEKIAMNGRIRSLLERIISRFSCAPIDTDFFKPSDTSAIYLGLTGERSCQLTCTADAPFAPTGLFTGVTPTLLVNSGDLLMLHEFMSAARMSRSHSRSPPTSNGHTSQQQQQQHHHSNISNNHNHSVRRHYSFSYSSSSATAAISAIDSREEFSLLFTQMSTLLEDLRLRINETPALLYIADNGTSVTTKDPQIALANLMNANSVLSPSLSATTTTAATTTTTSTSTTMSNRASSTSLPLFGSFRQHHQRDRSDVSTMSSSSSLSASVMIMHDDPEEEEFLPSDNNAPADLYTISAAVFRALNTFDVFAVFPGSSHLSVVRFLEAASQTASARGDFADSMIYQTALDRLRQLPVGSIADYVNHSDPLGSSTLWAKHEDDAALIRFMARRFDYAAEKRAVRQQYRNAWWAYAQDRQRRIQEITAARVYQFSSLRLRMFYVNFRSSRIYEKTYRSIVELSSNELQGYLEMRHADNFVPGDDIFHQFCREVERLRDDAMQSIWISDLFIREATLLGPPGIRAQISRQRSSSAAAVLMGRFAFTRSSTTGSSQYGSSNGNASSYTSNTAPSPVRMDAHTRSYTSTFGSASFNSLANTLWEPNARRHNSTPGNAYASLLGDDFITITQLKLVGLIMSEFHLLFRRSETDSWFNQLVGESALESPVLRPAAEPVLPASTINAASDTRPCGISANGGIRLAAATTTTATTTATATSATMNRAGAVPIVLSESTDASISDNGIQGAAPLFCTGLRRVDSVATLVPVSSSPRSTNSSTHSNISSRHGDTRRSVSPATTASPDMPSSTVDDDDELDRFSSANKKTPRNGLGLYPIATTANSPTAATAAATTTTTTTPTMITAIKDDRHTDFNLTFMAACNALCTQLTLHPSPFRKLQTLLSINLLISARLAASEAPGTDAIVNELVRVLRQIRPRYLCRDLQSIATFVPETILTMTDAGKAFVDASVAVMSLKEEIIREVIDRGRLLLGESDNDNNDANEGATAILARRNSMDDRESQLRQFEAFRLFMIAAKEGNPEGERELAILYLTLPITPDHWLPELDHSIVGAVNATSTHATTSPIPLNDRQQTTSNDIVSAAAASVLDVANYFVSGANTTSSSISSNSIDGNVSIGGGIYGNLGAATSSASLLLSAQMADKFNEKYNAANIAAAMKWFRRAAKKGDAVSIRYLEQQQYGG